MKRIILTLAAVLVFGLANAQDKQSYEMVPHDMWAEGSFSFRSGDVEDSWSFNPKIGYMIKDKWGVGGFLALSGSDDNALEENKFGIGAFARYYFLTLGEQSNFQAYGELGLGYSSVKTNGAYDAGGNFDLYPDGDHSDGEMNLNLDLGMNYFFTKKWAAVFELANIISYNNTNPEGGSNSSDLNVNVNLFNNIFAQPQFGLLYRW